MTVPKGYHPIGPKWDKRADAIKDAKYAQKTHGDSYIVRPVKSGKNILYYQVYWKRTGR